MNDMNDMNDTNIDTSNETDADPNPAAAVTAGVERTLELARTWLAWDGRPRVSEDGERIYTPGKVIRRYTHHLVDHLAEIEALLAGRESRPDGFRGSFVTLPADLAVFTESDLNEARETLHRLADAYVHRFEAAGPEAWDAPRDPHWTLRAIVEHVGKPWYAEQFGAA